MKKYPIRPEIVVLTGVKVSKSDFRIPEVKIRFNRGKHYDKSKITSARDAYPLLKSIAGRMVETQEMGIFLYLNRANNVLGYYKHTVGGTAGVPFDIKIIMAGAVNCLAHGIIACHNHPSGNLQPSQADINVTKLLKKAAEVHDIMLLDHLIITGEKDKYTSLAEDGLMGLSGINGLKGTTMITKTNYFEQIKGVKIDELPEALKEGHEYMVEFKDLIGKDSAIDEVIDDYIGKLNTWVVKHLDKPVETHSKPKAEKKRVRPEKKHKETRKEKVKRGSKPKKNRGKKAKTNRGSNRGNSSGNTVKFSEGVKLLRRVKPILNKVRPLKSIQTLHKAFMTAFTEQKVRLGKMEGIPKMIYDIEKILRKSISEALKQKQTHIKIAANPSSERYQAFLEAIKKRKIYDSVKVIKRYIHFMGKSTPEEAEALKKHIDKILSEHPKIKYARELKTISVELNHFKSNKAVPYHPPVALHGLLTDCGWSEKKNDIADHIPDAGKMINSSLEGVIRADNFENARFYPMGLTGKWKELLGDIVLPTTIMAWGLPGSGKSTFAIKFACELAKKHNKKVLYVAREEGAGATFHDKMKRFDAFSPNIFIAERLPENLKGYDFVFLDSVNELNLTFNDLERLIKENLGLSWVYIFKSTKTGNFRGSQDFEHLVDVSVSIKDGVAETEKSRFGGKGEFFVM